MSSRVALPQRACVEVAVSWGSAGVSSMHVFPMTSVKKDFANRAYFTQKSQFNSHVRRRIFVKSLVEFDFNSAAEVEVETLNLTLKCCLKLKLLSTRKSRKIGGGRAD